MNQGILTTLFCLASVYIAIFARIFFKEKLLYVQYAGVGMLLACTICLGFSRSSSSEEAQQSSVEAVVLAILSSLFFASRAILLKLAVLRGSTMFSLSVDHVGVDAVLGSILFIVRRALKGSQT